MTVIDLQKFTRKNSNVKVRGLLREGSQEVDKIGELRYAEDVDLESELGNITDISLHKFGSPAKLFRKIKGYEGRW